MTDILDVISIKLSTVNSHVERRVLTRARDEIRSLRARVSALESQIVESNINPKQLTLFGYHPQNLGLVKNG